MQNLKSPAGNAEVRKLKSIKGITLHDELLPNPATACLYLL